MVRNTSYPVKNVKIMPKLREKEAPHNPNRHKAFQEGTNPAQMTAFEKSLVAKEAKEREDARRNYEIGIQGRDGGCWPRQQFEDDTDYIQAK